MNRTIHLVIVALASVTLVLAVQTLSSAKPVAADETVQPPAPRVVPRVERDRLTPMHREIFDTVEAERSQIELLNIRFSKATLPGDKVAIQKEIESVKKAGMVNVFEIQLRYAKSEGREDVARELQVAIDAVKNPRLPQMSGPTMLQKMGK